MLKKLEDIDKLENEIFLKRSIFSAPKESTFDDLDVLFGELNSGIIVIDKNFQINYTNSIYRKLGIHLAEPVRSKNKITELLPLIINQESLVSFYEHLMHRRSLVIDKGFQIPRIDKILLSPISEGRFLIKILINELYTDSASNLLRYFPNLPFAFCGIRMDYPKKLLIEFYSDNFSSLLNNNLIESDEGRYFENLIHIEDLAAFLKKYVPVRKDRSGGFTQELRLRNHQENTFKWYRIHLSRYKESVTDPICLIYLQDINEEKLQDELRDNLVNEIVENERERTSMDLHDGLGQQMVAMKIHLDIVKMQVGNSKELNICSSILTDAILQLRTIINDMAPADVNEDLLKSVDKLFGKLNECSNQIEYKFQSNPVDLKKITQPDKNNIIRIIQEFISNSQKHSNCKNITCEIGKKNQKVAILLTDDGIGFNFQTVNRGFGLTNMEKRAKLLNAKFEFNSSPSGGTYLYLEI